MAWDLMRQRWVPTQGFTKKRLRFLFRELVKRDSCVYCGNPQTDGLDHIQPRILHGPDRWSNRAAACAKCDSAKSGQHLLLFLVSNQSRKQRIEKYYNRLLRRVYGKEMGKVSLR